MTQAELKALIEEAQEGLSGFAYGPGGSMVRRLTEALTASTSLVLGGNGSYSASGEAAADAATEGWRVGVITEHGPIGVPVEWVLVPKEPTKDMLVAGLIGLVTEIDRFCEPRVVLTKEQLEGVEPITEHDAAKRWMDTGATMRNSVEVHACWIAMLACLPAPPYAQKSPSNGALPRHGKPLTVLQVACLSVGGAIVTLPRPARHSDVMHLMVFRPGPEAQGFLLSDGSFADREEAYRVARAAGQPWLRDAAIVSENLFTEDLW